MDYISKTNILYIESIRKTNTFIYREADDHATILLQESKWSKATYAYQKACYLCMRLDTLSEGEKAELEELMR